MNNSKAFPGTQRTITVYIPGSYKAEKPACVYVGLDGLGLGVTRTFDELISGGELPVILGIGISSGTTPSRDGKDPRYNRSLEFDAMNDRLAEFVINEIFPAVKEHRTPGGLPILLSDDPNDRCTGGASTGGIAAFTLAWERPDQFRRVFTGIGTFVDMRGGDQYPSLIRQTEPKPIRVFQQDNDHDEWGGGPEVGDWWLGNQAIDRALDFAGYEHAHSWGAGGHDGHNAEACLPDAMRYLWKDWPKPVDAQCEKSGSIIFKQTIDPHFTWEAVAQVTGGERMAALADGTVLIAGKPGRRINIDGSVVDWTDAPTGPFAVSAENQVVASDVLNASDITQTHSRDQYAITSDGTLFLTRSDGTKNQLDAGIDSASAVRLSPDGSWLVVFSAVSPIGYSYKVQADGTVTARQPFYRVHARDGAAHSGVAGICFDHGGRLYAATEMGVQILDRNGRARGILPLPGNAAATAVCFGGPQFHTLYALTSDRLFRRRMNTTGAAPFVTPFALEPWGPG